MGRMHNNNSHKNNKHKLPQTPKNMKYDGQDVEYSAEFADHADLEAMARANAANQRVQAKRK